QRPRTSTFLEIPDCEPVSQGRQSREADTAQSTRRDHSAPTSPHSTPPRHRKESRPERRLGRHSWQGSSSQGAASTKHHASFARRAWRKAALSCWDPGAVAEPFLQQLAEVRQRPSLGCLPAASPALLSLPSQNTATQLSTPR